MLALHFIPVFVLHRASGERPGGVPGGGVWGGNPDTICVCMFVNHEETAERVGTEFDIVFAYAILGLARRVDNFN